MDKAGPVQVSGPVLFKNITSQIAVPPQRAQIAQPAFRDVLQETAGLAAGKTVAVTEGKTVALSLRVSDVEQARIQAGAAQANLSVSAYLRQCAMGVDELRNQVRLALCELQKGDSKPAPLPGLRAIPGILTRFANQCLERLRGRQD
jgi:hypothetical protein